MTVASGPARSWVTVTAGGLGIPADGPVTLPELRPVAGEPVVEGRVAGERVTLAARTASGGVQLAFDPDLAVEALIWRRGLTAGRPLAARMPFHYHRVPAPLRRLLRDLLARRSSGSADEFPRWPGDASVEAVRRIYLRARQALDPSLQPAPFWPNGRRFALALTHDVDSAEGLEVSRSIAAEERERGLSGCWYVVGGDYPLDRAALADLSAGGGELGLHDAHHDNKVAFLDAGAAGSRLDGMRAVIDEHAMRGFRSPSMLRSAALYEALEGRFAYDSSIPDSGLLPARNGSATVFPFRRGRLPVLPLTLPPDGQLLGRGLSPREVFDAWVAKAEWVAELGGAVVHLSHPEPGFSASREMRAVLREFLDWSAERAAAGDAWHATPAEIIEHWTARERAHDLQPA